MQQVILDLSVKPDADDLPKIHVKQGDSNRCFEALILDGGREYSIPERTGFTVWFSGTGGQGNYASVNGTSAFSVSGSKVTVCISPMLTAVKGGGVMCLVMNDADGEQLGLWDICYVVEGLPGIEGTNAEDTYAAYRDLLEQAVQAAQRVTDIAHGGTGATSIGAAQTALRLSQVYTYAQVDSTGDKIYTGIDAYPNRPGVFRVTTGYATVGVPANYGVLVIYNGGGYYMHLYVTDSSFYTARTNTLIKPNWKEMASTDYLDALLG